MRPMAAAAIGALVSGVAFYAVGTRAAQPTQPGDIPALVQTVDGRLIQVPDAQPVAYPQPLAYVPNGYAAQLQTPASPVLVQQPVSPVLVQQPAPAPTRTVYRTVRTAQPAQERVVYERSEPQRSVAKTALIIGGSAASGAGVGGLIGGKKGALVGAAIGGGAASIYEASRRR